MGGEDYDPRYLSYFDLFNRQRFFEAHEVLEALWLPRRQEANGDFYKGLIQLAGAFVHWQKHRPAPAAALLERARTNLGKYPATHERLDVQAVVVMIDEWLRRLKAVDPGFNPPAKPGAPQLRLEAPGHAGHRHDGRERS
jgi:hypothetical protein